MTDTQPEPKRNWLLRHKFLSGIGAIVVIVIIAVAAGGGGSKGHKITAEKPVSTPTSTAQPAPGGVTPGSPAASAAPAKSTTPAKPSPKVKKRDNSSAKVTTLGAGSFTVGQDLPPGRYVITPQSGQSGNLSASSSDNPLAINEILGEAGGLGVPSVTTTLTRGEVVKISGMSAVTFAPATTSLRTSLSAGDWEVGLDIAAGRYVAAPAHGGSGNFVVYDKDGLPKTNEVLGDAGGLGVPNVTVSLSNGDLIRISGLSEVTFSAK